MSAPTGPSSPGGPLPQPPLNPGRIFLFGEGDARGALSSRPLCDSAPCRVTRSSPNWAPRPSRTTPSTRADGRLRRLVDDSAGLVPARPTSEPVLVHPQPRPTVQVVLAGSTHGSRTAPPTVQGMRGNRHVRRRYQPVLGRGDKVPQGRARYLFFLVVCRGRLGLSVLGVIGRVGLGVGGGVCLGVGARWLGIRPHDGHATSLGTGKGSGGRVEEGEGEGWRKGRVAGGCAAGGDPCVPQAPYQGHGPRRGEQSRGKRLLCFVGGCGGSPRAGAPQCHARPAVGPVPTRPHHR